MNQLDMQKQITEANEKYRTGNPIMTDAMYDQLCENYVDAFGDDDFISKIGHKPNDDRMQTLPIIMGSMNKIKTIEEYQQWLKSKGIPGDTLLVATPKLDGASLCHDEDTSKDAWTRGDGIEGQYSKGHIALIGVSSMTAPIFSFGEAIMKRSVFDAKYAEDYANPRNLVSGLLNSKTPSDVLKDVDYIRYGIEMKDGRKGDKTKQLDICNKLNTVKIPYITLKASEVTTQILVDLFTKWSVDYEIDGIILDVNDNTLRENLGRETSKPNPCFARAFKGNFEEVKETTCISITYGVSKTGKLAPVAQVNPVNCNGATVTNVTLYNAKYVQEIGLCVGSTLTIKRSGMVIPKVVEVLTPGVVKLPTHCPVCGEPLVWSEPNAKGEVVHLVCINIDCPATATKKIYSFFETIGADNCGEGTLDLFIAAGYDTIKKILALEIADIRLLDRMGDRKAKITYDGIHSKLVNIKLPVIQHASSFFLGLGSKKLAVAEEAMVKAGDTSLWTKAQIIKHLETVDGFSTKSAAVYANGIEKFRQWIQNVPCVIKYYTGPAALVSTKFQGMVCVFTGYRPSAAIEELFVSNGGVIASGISKNSTHLVMKETGSGSGKETKALALGQIILDKKQFEALIGE